MLRTPRHHRHTRHQGERGQVLVITGMLLAVLGGMAALAVDLGSYMGDRRELQNDADAIALAAAQELPNSGEVQAAANEWAGKNNIDISGMTVTIIPQGAGEPNPKVRVELERDHAFTFARLIGIESTMVETAAAAIKTSPAGGANVIPLSVQEDDLAGMALGDPVVLKYDANNLIQGNAGPIRIDGPGSGNCTTSDNYCLGVEHGAENVVCAAGADPTYCSGPSQVDAQPGNLVGGTREAIEYRMDNTDAQCDTFAEVMEDDPTTNEAGVYRIAQECNPFVSGSYDSNRIVIVPVIEELCSGSCTVTIVDFALFFLEDFGNGNYGDNGNQGNGNNVDNSGGGSCTGNECEVVGRFFRANQNVRLLAGTYDPNAFNHFVRLVE